MNEKQAHNTEKAISQANSRREALVCHAARTDGRPVVRAWVVYTGNLYKNIKRNPE